MLKELEDTLRSLTLEDKIVLKDLLLKSMPEDEPAPMQLAGNIGDGVMTIQAHKAYEDATGESLIRRPEKKEKEVERWGGKDSKLIEEWKERNRERQNEDFKRLLKRRG